jgi:hypothetical protein
VAKLKDRPFALIGVNVNESETKNLKERMAKDYWTKPLGK